MISAVVIQGCNSGGDITPEMQKQKQDALKKASEKEGSTQAPRGEN